MEYLLIFISAIFVNNIVLSQFLGICPFLGVSQKISTSLGMGAAVAFVLTLSTIVTYLVQIYILNPMGLQYLQTIAFILVIAALVQMVEIILKKVSPSLYQALEGTKARESWRDAPKQAGQTGYNAFVSRNYAAFNAKEAVADHARLTLSDGRLRHPLGLGARVRGEREIAFESA